MVDRECYKVTLNRRRGFSSGLSVKKVVAMVCSPITPPVMNFMPVCCMLAFLGMGANAKCLDLGHVVDQWVTDLSTMMIGRVL